MRNFRVIPVTAGYFRLLPGPFGGCLLLLCLGCGSDSVAPTGPQNPSTPGVSVPAEGTSTTLDIANWNLQWFGDASNGPSNDALQESNVRAVIAGTDYDIWGLAEVVSAAAFDSLRQATGYAGLLANEALVGNGAAFYSANEQKVALLWKPALATLVSARLILTGNDFDFAGRPPLEARLRVTLNGRTAEIVVIVLHMKAFDDAESWQRRQNASVALKNYIDTAWPTQQVFVIGDWNDDIDTSITTGRTSPYENFVADAARYRFPTMSLSAARISSTSFPDLIDHQLNSNEVVVAGQPKVYRLDSHILSFANTTSDHYPVLVRYGF